MHPDRARQQIANEAARILCEDGVLDYKLAKAKAVEAHGGSRHAPLPTNREIHQAMLDYQSLFGGEQVAERLHGLRQLALKVMREFADFRPRLVGPVLSGAIGLEPARDRIQLHVFADAAEELDLHLLNRGWPFEPDERRYLMRKGQHADIPLLRFELDTVEIELAVFPNRGRGHAPLSAIDHHPMPRASRSEVSALLSD
ncbi:hypothetical protein GYB61_07045 [bacterium]|nr:hypothetical protein [bacterium]